MELIKRIKNLFTKPQKVSVPEFPQSVLLEPTNACNLRCRMCAIWGEGVKRSREVGFIKREVWTKILDEIGSWPVHINLDIHGAGEPLLHPDFIDILTYAKSKDNLHVGFLCNATLFDSKKAEIIVELGIDWVGFSVDGAQKEIFEYYRKGTTLAVVESNIEKLIALKNNNKPSIFLNMVRHSEADIDLFIERWKGKVDTLQLSIKRPVNREQNKQIIFTKPCPLPYQQLIIGWSGHSVLCCEDCWGDYLIGKFPEDTLYTLWHGRAIETARLLHEQNRQRRISLCRSCDSSTFHEYLEFRRGKTFVRIEQPAIREEYGSLITR